MTAKFKVYSEMIGELEARKRVLTNEKETLLKSSVRIAAIDEELAVIDAELSEYVPEVEKLAPKEVKEEKK